MRRGGVHVRIASFMIGENLRSAAAAEKDDFHSVLSTNHSSASVRFDRSAVVCFAGRNSGEDVGPFEEVERKLAFVPVCAAYCI